MLVPAVVAEVAPDLADREHVSRLRPVVVDPRVDVVRDKRLRRRSAEPALKRLGDRVEDPRNGGEDQIVLGGEVIGDDALAHARALRDFTHRRALKAKLDDGANRAVDQLLPPLALRERGRSGVADVFSTHGGKLVRSYESVKPVLPG